MGGSRDRRVGYSESCKGVTETVVCLALQRVEDGGVEGHHRLYLVGLPETLSAVGHVVHERGIGLENVADIAGITYTCVYGGLVDVTRHIEEQKQ
jgi:hypothetical protein